jgi:hypothetical protein
VATAGAAATSPVLTQQDLQTLNSALTALGLNAAEIAAFDQFAGVLLQFDPNALRELESQLNLLASQFQTQNAAPANTAAQITTPTTAATQAPANTPGFQLNELSVSFTGLNGALNSGNTNAPNTQFSTFNLQIKEVQVTLGNSAGQTAQLKVQGTGGHTPAPAAKSATA